MIYSTVPITFHIITNKDSVKYVNTIVEMINKTSNCDFSAEIVTLADIIDKTTTEICPSMNIKDEFCEIIMGNMTPLIFPYLFSKLDHAIYISREIVFQVREEAMLTFQVFPCDNNIKTIFKNMLNLAKT